MIKIKIAKAIRKTFVAGLCAFTLVAALGCGGVDNSNNNNESNQSNASMQETQDAGVKKAAEAVLTRSGEYPEYYKTEVLDTIKTTQNKLTGQAVSYIFVTDLHYDSGGSEQVRTVGLRTLNAVVDVANNTDIDFVCVGGDLHDGRHYEGEAKKEAMDCIEQVSKILENCNKPVFILKGNHDDNSFSAQQDGNLLFDPNYIINNEEWYKITMAHFSQYATDYHNGYYYYDLPNKNVRVICLNMSDSDDGITDGKRNEMGMYFYGYKDAQIEWLLNNAMSRKDCEYVVLCHDSFYYSSGYGEGSNRDTIQDIMAVAYNHSNFDNGKFKKDFSGYGNLLLYHAGHTHMNRFMIDEAVGGLPSIHTSCSKFQTINSTASNTSTTTSANTNASTTANANSYSNRMSSFGFFRESQRQANTITEAVFDVVVHNPQKIDVVRFGAGDDRSMDVKY